MWKPRRCQISGDYGTILEITLHELTFCGDSIKSVARATRQKKKKSFRMINDRPDVTPAHNWRKIYLNEWEQSRPFLSENFLFEMLIQNTKNLPQEYEIVTGSGFVDYSGAKSTISQAGLKINGIMRKLTEGQFFMPSDAVDIGYQRFLVLCRVADAMFFLHPYF